MTEHKTSRIDTHCREESIDLSRNVYMYYFRLSPPYLRNVDQWSKTIDHDYPRRQSGIVPVLRTAPARRARVNPAQCRLAVRAYEMRPTAPTRREKYKKSSSKIPRFHPTILLCRMRDYKRLWIRARIPTESSISFSSCVSFSHVRLLRSSSLEKTDFPFIGKGSASRRVSTVSSTFGLAAQEFSSAIYYPTYNYAQAIAALFFFVNFSFLLAFLPCVLMSNNPDKLPWIPIEIFSTV